MADSSSRFATPMESVQPLAEPLRFPFSGKTAQNRFAKAAMSERMATWLPHDRPACGIPSDALITLYARWGETGEIGLFVTGAVAIDANYLESPGNAIIPLDSPTNDHRFEMFAKWAAVIKAKGSLAVVQLNQQGRQVQAALQPDPMSASDLKLEQNELRLEYNKPHPASEAELDDLVKRFIHGARYLESAGWDGVQLNAAHGYIFSQFLSRATNFRADQWGGSLENRARLLLTVVRAIREACRPDFLVSVKLNCVEYEPDGFSIDEVKQVSQWLEQARVDVIELSGGTYREWGWKHVRESTEKREGYFVEAAEQIRPVLKETKLYATGGFHSAGAMVDALQTVDGIGLGRPLAQNPTLCHDILHKGVTGMTKQDLDQSRYALTALLAGTQMRAMSQGLEPVDGSKPQTTATLMKRLESFMKERRANGWGEKYGHMDIESIQPVPYSTATQ